MPRSLSLGFQLFGIVISCKFNHLDNYFTVRTSAFYPLSVLVFIRPLGVLAVHQEGIAKGTLEVWLTLWVL